MVFLLPSWIGIPFGVLLVTLRYVLSMSSSINHDGVCLKIVRHLAQQHNINLPDETLTHQALQWAVRHNVRSGRTARQFIDYTRGQQR